MAVIKDSCVVGQILRTISRTVSFSSGRIGASGTPAICPSLLRELDEWFNTIEVVQEWGDKSLGKGCEGVISVTFPEKWGPREALQGPLLHILHHHQSSGLVQKTAQVASYPAPVPLCGLAYFLLVWIE